MSRLKPPHKWVGKFKAVKAEFPHDNDTGSHCKYCGLHEDRWPFQVECTKRKELEKNR